MMVGLNTCLFMRGARMNQIKLSLDLKRNTPYMLRNLFLSFVNNNSDIDNLINKDIDHIRESIFKYNTLEVDIDLSESLNKLKNYLKENVLNYKEVKKALMRDIKNTTPKPKLNIYLAENIRNNYYIKCIKEAV